MMSPELEFYLDEKGSRRPAQDEKGNTYIRFDRTMVGKESSTVIYMKNMLEDTITAFRPITSDPDLHIVSYPKSLSPGAVAKVELVFRPKPERRTPLKDATWTFEIDIG